MNYWELYECHAEYAAADAAINRAWDEAVRLMPERPSAVRARAAEEHVYNELAKWRRVGALDTEPLAHLRYRVREHFGVNGGYV